MMMNYSSNSKIDRRNSTNTNQNYSYTNLSDTGTPNKSQASAKHISAKKQQVIAGLQKYQYQDSSPSKSQINKMQNNSNRNNSNDLFNSLFDTMKQNIISENKSNDINNLRFSHNEFMYNTPIGQSQQQIMKEQVIKKYQERKELTIKKYKQIIDDCEKVKDQIIHTETKFHNLLDTLENKFETQMDQQINQFEQKLLSQGAFDITKNWVFSLIVDMEKCTRYSQLKSLQQLDIAKEKLFHITQNKIILKSDNSPTVSFQDNSKNFERYFVKEGETKINLELEEEQNEYESDFEQENNSPRESKIQLELEDFYIIEENSAFSTDEMNSRVISKERRVQKIRKLNDVEIASLILLYYQAKELAQNMEIKFNQDLIRKMNDLAKQQFNHNSELSPQLEINRFESQNNYNYILIDKVDKSSKSENSSIILRFEEQLTLVICLSIQFQSQKTLIWHQKYLVKRSGNSTQNDKIEFLSGFRALRVSISQILQEVQINQGQILKNFNPSIEFSSIQQHQYFTIASELKLKYTKSHWEQCCWGHDQQYTANFEYFDISKHNTCFIFQLAFSKLRHFRWQIESRNVKKRFLKDSIITNTNFDQNFLKYNKSQQSTRFMYQSQIIRKLFIMQKRHQLSPLINNLENFLKWLDSYISNQKLIFMKNPHFQEANSHFTNQIAQFNGNLTQALENEKYIVNEMKQWVEQSQQIPKQFIKENLGQIFEVIKTKDMIMKFQQFQFIIDKVNSLRNNTNPAGQYDQYLTLLQRYPQNQFLNQFNQFQQQNQQTPFNYQQASQSILPKITDGNTPISMNQTTAQNFYNANKMNNINIQGNNSSVNNRIGIIGSNNSGGDGSSKNSQNSNNNINNFGNQQSQVVEKLTSIYGGPSLKKNQTVGDQATSNVKQMIEQRLISSDTQNFSLKQSSQMPQSNSLLARKQSAGSRKDFVLPPPSTQELQNLSQMNSTYMKNNLPLSNQKIPSMQNIQNQQNSLILANNEYAAGIQKKQAIKHIGQIKIINSNANNASNCQSSPLSRSLYKVNFGQPNNNGQLSSTGGIQVQHKQRASSAYKQRQDGNMIVPLPQAQTQQISNVHIRPSSSTSHQYLPPQNSQLSNPLQQVQGPYQQQLQSLQHLQANNFINTGLPPTNTLISNTPVPQMLMGNMMNQQQQINYQYPNQMFQQQQQQIYASGMANNADPLQNQYNFTQSSNSNFGMPIVATSILQNRKSEGPSSQLGGLPAPKYPINNQFTPQQMQLQQIYNTKLNKPVLMGQQTTTQGFFNNNNQQQQQIPQNPLQHAHTSIQISTSKQRQQERQNAIVMTYTNAVPRINSANPGNTDKKLGGGNKQALGGTFYGDSKIGSTITTTGKKSKKANRDTSDRKQTKLNNFLKN
eukprot:403334449